MPTCNWSLLCPGTNREGGILHADDDAQLTITFDDGGKLIIGHDDDRKTVTIEGDVTLKRIGSGNVHFVGGAGVDTSGVTGVSGKLVFNLSTSTSLDVKGQVDPRSGDVQGAATLTIRF